MIKWRSSETPKNDGPPTATLGDDGKVYISGEKHPYIQGMIRHFNFVVEPIELIRGFSSNWEDPPEFGAQISGAAKVQRGDALRIAGWSNTENEEINFSVRAAPLDSNYEWTAQLGYLSFNWEIGHRSYFYIDCYVPQNAFAQIEQSYLSGRAHSLSVSLKTTLWVRDFDRHTPQSGSVNWYLIPEIGKPSSELTKGETGQISSLSWKEVIQVSHPSSPQ